MKNTTSHHHLNIGNKRVLCAIDYEKELKQYDVTLWCDNRIIGREKLRAVNIATLTRLATERVKKLRSPLSSSMHTS